MLKEIDIPRELSAPKTMSFVGWKGYPKVRVAPLLSLAPPSSPGELVERPVDVAVQQMVRSVRPYVLRRVDAARDPDYSLILLQELSMAKGNPVVDAELERIMEKITFSPVTQPMGPAGPARKIREEENVRVIKPIEKLYYDDIKAEDAVWWLYSHGLDVYLLVSPFSMGVFGEQRKRRMVPTRWAITAVDDIVSKRLRNKVLRYPPLDKILLFQSHHMDNHFYVILLPIPYSFELMEAWMPLSLWVRGNAPVIISDHEGPRGRKGYAENVGGSYYAARLAVLEFLNKNKRNAAALVLREVREGYFAPLGVWQVRENVRKAFNRRPLVFSDPREVVEYIKEQTRVSDLWFKKSWLWDRFLHQRLLPSYSKEPKPV